jgi:membrane-associated phospholipid phosphatase
VSARNQLLSRWRNRQIRDTLAASGFYIRYPEAVALCYFFYLALLTLGFHDRPHADARVLRLALTVTVITFALAWSERNWNPLAFSIVRDWWALALVLIAYRSLNWFSPQHYSLSLERSFLHFDAIILEQWQIRRAIENWGRLLPACFETCYLLTSGAGCYVLAILYAYRKRDRCDCFLLIYIVGTLLSYALIPFFPSEPPRVVFPRVDAPQVHTAIRTFNLAVLSGAGIHSGVFPSAHVSSTFAAAWGLFRCLPEYKVFGWLFLCYAASVAVATVYGRYHFAWDAIAGIVVSLLAWAVCSRVGPPAPKTATSD